MKEGNLDAVKRIGGSRASMLALSILHLAYTLFVMWLVFVVTKAAFGAPRITAIVLSGVLGLLPISYLTGFRRAYEYLTKRSVI